MQVFLFYLDLKKEEKKHEADDWEFLVETVKYLPQSSFNVTLQASSCKAYVHRGYCQAQALPKCHANANISVPLVM